LGAGLQRKPPGAALLYGNDCDTGTVAIVPETGKLIPPSVERAHMTLFDTFVIVWQQVPRCQAATTAPFGWIAAEAKAL
jgi:hypothetical protein